MQNYTLLIAGDNSESIINIKPKLGLSRELDKIIDTKIKSALGFLKNCTPDVILFVIDEKDDKVLDICKKIRDDIRFKLTPIVIYIEKKYNEEFMQKAFKIGIDDFIYCPVKAAEIELRVKANLKKRTAFQNVENQKVFLRDFGVLDENDIYTQKFAFRIFDINVDNVNKANHSFILLLLSYPEPKELVGEIKKHIRLSDTVGQLSSNIYYLIMPKTTLNRSKSFYRKIKENLEYELNASACEYNSLMDFKGLTTTALKALKEASLVGDTIVATSFSDIETFVGSIAQKPVQDYKIFQKVFDKKTQNVILPAFQNIKLQLDEKYPYNVQIDFFATGTKCYFSIKDIGSELELALKINYLGRSKLDVETIYTHKTHQTSNSMDFDLNDLTDKIIYKIINNVTNEFDRLIG